MIRPVIRPNGGDPQPVGDACALFEQLGSPTQWIEGGFGHAGACSFALAGAAGLRQFLEAYRDKVLYPAELPAIVQARGLASVGAVRELVDLDRDFAGQLRLRPFAAASRRVGRQRLRHLRPLRGDRVLRRFLDAVEEGQAHGWHPLVYGIMLVLYSLPLRQGLQHYAQEAMHGLATSVARSLGVPAAEGSRLADAALGQLPGIVGGLCSRASTRLGAAGSASPAVLQ